MNPRSPIQPYLSNSLAIRQEIQRFESVHPSIYAIYDLIEAIPDPLIQQQIREHVVCIEDSFVNSQEWTLSRGVPDLKLGILGSVQSGKSALVHRYLTGSYMQEESPEGGRFKKEVMIDGQSYLLLIRDEGGAPEMQVGDIPFTQWVDAVIFVFSLENEISFQAVYSYYAKMAHYRNTAEIPLILVGTQDAISESNPRLIDDTRARKLASDLKRCSYYETCATYGLNVERVFQDACQKISQMRYPSLPLPVSTVPTTPTPNHSQRSYYMTQSSVKGYDSHSTSSQSTSSSGTLVTGTSASQAPPVPSKDTMPKDKDRDSKTDKAERKMKDKQQSQSQLQTTPQQLTVDQDQQDKPDGKDLPTPSSTPTQNRKNRRRSNLFNPKKGEDEKKVENEKLGSGRVIPLKQGYLHKKSHGLNKDWKKKYVTLLDDGRLMYHPSLHDYMDDVHAKEINLVRTTVKIPGLRPKGSRIPSTGGGPANGVTTEANNTGMTGKSGKEKENVMLTAFDALRDGQQRVPSVEDAIVISNSSITPGIPNGLDNSFDKKGVNSAKIETPNVKKRHRRAKSGGLKNIDTAAGEDSDGYEFIIVSLDNKQWHFEAQSNEERDDWVQMIEQQILSSLQANESSKSKSRSNTLTDPAGVQAIRNVRGNNTCVDCGAPNPDWASINLGALLCIECSGIHRNLGTHLTRVRSLDLDEWPPDLVAVMTSIGNSIANSVWEANTKGRTKPNPASPREEKERWVRTKYDQKEFLPPPPYVDIPLNQQLIDALVREDIRNIILLLAHACPDDINAPYNKDDGRTALHIAAALGNVVFVQLLLWYSANVKVLDHEGRNALWYAKSSGATDCMDMLVNHGCPENPTLPRRRGSSQPAPGKNDVFEKLPASVI
ncbi:arf-GAP with GTPase, ANK repeat and PH domain-containing protein 1-like isoform X6 [Liolophura sinensis]|uniref:arf-GAP with GTPase, ANK repeat and PH domain-containing protein 1-like isoform X6 n=1 Tax=Liolophura sinensis TaxID=3198878 RepID=UPI00315906F5